MSTMKTSPSLLRGSLLAGMLLTAFCWNASSMFVGPTPTPIDRVLKNAETFLAKHPDSTEARYTVARAHYLAFHLKSSEVPAFRNDESGSYAPRVAPQWMLGWGVRRQDGENTSKELPAGELVAHAAKALQGFRDLLGKNPDDGLTQLGIASLLEEFAEWSRAKKDLNLPPELSDITPAKIREAYAKTLTLALKKDSELTHLPLSGLQGIVSHEAASALIRLAKGVEEKLAAAERADLEAAKKALEHFKTLHMAAVTPIVFSFKNPEHLDTLLSSEAIVDFDLRGYGPRERWPWIKPELGLLVWDPERAGIIRSAHQLFGGYTFQLFRANGYDALAALDDNGDGVLSGAELDGISVWFDRNSDGVSSPNEVFPLRDLGVTSIAVTMDGHDGIHPTNSRGITMHDGRTLRTWDWMVRPVARSPVAKFVARSPHSSLAQPR